MDSSFNNPTFFLCPECKHDIPLVTLIPHENDINIKIQCSCSKQEKTCSIKSFLKSTRSPPNTEFNNCSSLEHNRKGDMFCPDCIEWYCEECLKFHQKYRANHHLIEYDIKVNCEKHKQNYTYYCMSCKQSICRECHINHQGHELVSITPVDIQAVKDKVKAIEALMNQNTYYNSKFSLVTEAKIESLQIQIDQLNQLKDFINTSFERNQMINNYLKKYMETLIEMAYFTTGRPNYQIMKNIKDIKMNEANVDTNEDNYKRFYFSLKSHFETNYVLSIEVAEKKYGSSSNTKRRRSFNENGPNVINRRAGISKEPNNYLNEIESLIFANNDEGNWNISALPSKYQGKLPTLIEQDPTVFPDDVWEAEDIAKKWITQITPNQFEHIEAFIKQLEHFDFKKLIMWKLGHLLKHLFNTLLSTKSTNNYMSQFFKCFINSINLSNTNEVIAHETLTFLANMMLFSLRFPIKFHYKDIVDEEDISVLNIDILRLLNFENIINNTILLRYGIFICFCHVLLPGDVFDNLVRKIMRKNDSRFHCEDLNTFCLIFVKNHNQISNYSTYFKAYDDSCGNRWVMNAILIQLFHSHNYINYTSNSDMSILSTSSLSQLLTVFNSKKSILKTDLYKNAEIIQNQHPIFCHAIKEILQNNIINATAMQIYAFNATYLLNSYLFVSEIYHSNDNYRLIGFIKIDGDNINDIVSHCLGYDDKNNKIVLTSYGFNRKICQQVIPNDFFDNWIMSSTSSNTLASTTKRKSEIKNATFYFYFNTNAGKEQLISLPSMARVFDILGKGQKDYMYPLVYLGYFNSKQSIGADQITAIVNIFASMFNQGQLSIEFIEEIKDKYKHNAQDILMQLLKRMKGKSSVESK